MEKTKGNRYKYALVVFPAWDWGPKKYAVESKAFLSTYHVFDGYTIVCDDQPYNVLKGMLKLLEEKK